MKNAIKRSLSILLAITIIFGSAYVGLSEIDFSGIDFSGLFTVKAKAASESDLTFTLNADGNSYSVTGSNYPVGEVIIPSTYNNLPVTSIGECVFEKCKDLTSITIPGSVTNIGGFAFRYCEKLTSLRIPDSVISIGDYAFFECESLKYVAIGSGLCGIEYFTFYGCPIEELYVDSVAGLSICQSASPQNLKVTLGNNITYIPDNCFEGIGINELIIPNTVTSIGNYAFARSGLTKITIPDSVTSIGNWAFEGCANLTEVTIPSSLTYLSAFMFSECTNLNTINLHDNIKEVWPAAFWGTPMYNNPVNWVDGALYINDIFVAVDSTAVGELVIKPGTKIIAAEVLTGSSNITEIKIPETVTYISEWAFLGCDNLSIVTDCRTYAHEYAVTNNIPTSLIHNFNTEWTIDKEPSCTEPGSKSHHCSRCEEKNDVTEIIATGHNYVDGLCTTCNKTIGVEYLTFELNSDNASYSVTGCNTSAEGEIVIPSIYKGLPVTSIGDDAFSNCSSLTSITIPDSVTSIGNSAFHYCSSLTSVTIPDSVTSIGNNAFRDCTNLTSVYITDLTAWCNIDFDYGCFATNPLYYANNLYLNGELIENLVIPDGVTEIKNYAFWGCTSLTSVTIPDSVTSIDWDAFNLCTNLTSINVSENNQNYSSVDGVLFNKDKTELVKYPEGNTRTEYVIPDSVTSISGYAFEDCSNLTSITIPDSVTSIRGYAFEDCSNLTSITIPVNVSSIGRCSFLYCTGLERVNWNAKNPVLSWYDGDYFSFAGQNGSGINFVFGDSVEKIPAGIFRVGASGHEPYIKTITIGNNVTNMEDVDLSYCTSLTDFIVDENNKKYFSVDGVLYNKNQTEIIKFPKGRNDTSYVIPNSVTSIGDSAFRGCTNLSLITIPNSVTSISIDAFAGCSNLSEVIIPDSVKYIGEYAFYGCESLTSIEIPDNVIEIGRSAFLGTAYYDNLSNWDNDVLYIGNHLIEARETLSGVYTIKEGTKTISDSASFDCENLTSIIVPKSVTSIAYHAFSDCLNLESVYYKGTQAEWESVYICWPEPHYPFGNATLYFAELKQINGQWVYASGDTIITNYTGLVEYNGGWFYVANGVVDWNYTGLAEFCGNYYHIANGVLDWGYTGLSYYNGNWWYVTNGVIDWSYTGLTCFYDTWYYVTNGFLDWSVTTLTYFYDVWYYVENGVLNWNYTGLVEFCGNYYHIANGVLDWGYTGLSYYNGNWWYVTNGVIDWSYTGLTYYYGTWYYVTNGFLDWNVTTLTYFCDVWYYVENGQINWNSNTLCYYGDTWYYVKGGTVAWDYTGWVEYYGGWYYITNGWLDWSKQ